MFYHADAAIEQLSIHRVGNKMQDEFYVITDGPVALQDDTLSELLKHYFLSPFAKVNEVYHFSHPSGTLELNEMYHFADAFFTGGLGFHEFSQQVCKHLYAASNHPNIKGGELYAVHLRGVQMEGELHEAVGIFKSETKETYLKVYPSQGAFNVGYEQEAININKLDKGCIILNTARGEGYQILVIDQTNRQQEALYWKDDFLGLTIRNDAFNQTGNFLKIYKKFVNEALDDVFELERTDKIDLLNRSMNYFKEKEAFKQEEFEEEVLGNPKAVHLFNDYKQQFGEAQDASFGQYFDISNQAVKKAQATYKSVLKLDKNFHIYIHGKREYIEKGYDEEKGMNYYKVYFKEER
ncbi:hypothetical protein SAMN05421747_12010 [Parapedobacter composti]|uniref:Nucleoid associated protein NdpA n=1 Tax=Parapedobacter composti TaxID=623281 RepID=A0A1I1LA13_9SPHI|nr:nucleoid-associated protein [Parapedobacter composti]SFC69947.1 hypothetical protein SAMN05421747_12010 [Parapedobacter composti]